MSIVHFAVLHKDTLAGAADQNADEVAFTLRSKDLHARMSRSLAVRPALTRPARGIPL
jgi:hypothetical protein